MVRLVIFDFDGTLANTRDIHYEVYRRIAMEKGMTVHSREEIEKLSTLSIQARFKRFGVPLFKLPGLVRRALVIFGELIASAEMFPGIRELLVKLEGQKILMAVVSSNSVGNIRRFLSMHGISCFAHIKGKAPIFGKHRVIRRLVRKTGCRRQDVLYVGDEIRDILACRKIGVPVAAATWGYDHRDLLETGTPDHIVDQPMDLLDLCVPLKERT
ncbi:MAG: HAD hydrolase-like protein [Clostridia bacterium]